jgi:hypothetical protein
MLSLGILGLAVHYDWSFAWNWATGVRMRKDKVLFRAVVILALLGLTGIVLLFVGWRHPDVLRDLGVGLMAAIPVAAVVLTVEYRLKSQADDAETRRRNVETETRKAMAQVIHDDVVEYLERLLVATVQPVVDPTLSQLSGPLDANLSDFKGQARAVIDTSEVKTITERMRSAELPWSLDFSHLVYQTILHNISWWHGPDDALKRAAGRLVAPSARLAEVAEQVSEPLLTLALPADWREVRELSRYARIASRQARDLSQTEATSQERGFFFFFFFGDQANGMTAALLNACAAACLRVSSQQSERFRDGVSGFRREAEAELRDTTVFVAPDSAIRLGWGLSTPESVD